MFRAVHGLITIHHVNESNIMTELGKMAESVEFAKIDFPLAGSKAMLIHNAIYNFRRPLTL